MRAASEISSPRRRRGEALAVPTLESLIDALSYLWLHVQPLSHLPANLADGYGDMVATGTRETGGHTGYRADPQCSTGRAHALSSSAGLVKSVRFITGRMTSSSPSTEDSSREEAVHPRWRNSEA